MAAESTTIARPYAQAVFKRALETKRLEEWDAMLATLAAIVQDPQVAGLIADPKTRGAQQADLLIGIAGEHLDQEGGNLVRILVENDRLAVLPEIVEIYEVLKNEQQGAIDVEVISAFEVSDDDEKKLATALKKRFGCEVALTSRTDASLIGGAVIRAGDKVIDSSVKGRLQQLASSLA